MKTLAISLCGSFILVLLFGSLSYGAPTVSVTLTLNNTVYAPLDTQTVTVFIGGQENTVDLYLVVINPEGSFNCKTLDGFGATNQVVPIVANWTTLTGGYPLQISLPAGIAGGSYSWYGIATRPGADPLLFDNWLAWHSQTFTVDIGQAPGTGGVTNIPELVQIPAGSFLMGDDIQAAPKHPVTISKSFLIGKFEITNAEFAEFLSDDGGEGHHDYRMAITKDANFVYTPVAGKAQHPVSYVTFFGAFAYSNWLSKKTGATYRLPTEAEWEYAARGNTLGAYSFGPTIDATKANYGNNIGATIQVGAYPANSFGLYDVHGNVAELCADFFEPSFYASSPLIDPVNDFNGGTAVMRGGGWSDSAELLKSYYRRGIDKSITDTPGTQGIGFRIVKEID